MLTTSKSYKVLIVEDDVFTQKLISEIISNLGNKCETTTNIKDALDLVKSFSPDLVITELDFGLGQSGIDLIRKIVTDYPEIKIVVLTTHTSPALIDSTIKFLPSQIQYFVKSDLNADISFKRIIQNAFDLKQRSKIQVSKSEGAIYLSNTQAELLRLLAQGLSNKAIADKRNTSLRAVEALINRTYQALNLSESDSINLRVEAVKLWRSSRIYIK
jgi:DNA-binding NarL/FixJ family response regulator